MIAASLLLAAQGWTVQNGAVTSRLRGVSAVDDKTVFASGSASTIVRTLDGGETWLKLVPPSEDRLDYRDIDAVAGRSVYALSIGNGPLSRVYKSTDLGATWTEQFRSDDPKVFLDAMTFWDATRGIVVGDSIEGQFFIMTTDDGATWTRVPAAALPPALPNEGAFAASGTNVAVFGPTDVWFGTGAGPRARVLHSSDRGRTWQIAETPIRSGPSSGIYSVAFRDLRHGVVVGGDYAKEQEAVDNVAITSDGGKTWTLVKDKALTGFRSVVKYVPGTAASFLAVGPQGSDISIDDGKTWTKVEGPGYDTLTFAPSKPIGWGAGAGGAVGRFQ